MKYRCSTSDMSQLACPMIFPMILLSLKASLILKSLIFLDLNILQFKICEQPTEIHETSCVEEVLAKSRLPAVQQVIQPL